jgi:guanylate kinase
MSGKLIILSGPSCVGKSPLSTALGRFFPEIKSSLRPLVLYNDRSPRPGEKDGIDYYFRTRQHIESLKKDNKYIVLEVRGDLQALDIEELRESLKQADVFFEGNPFVGSILLELAHTQNIPNLNMFMTPISKEEILFLNSSDSNIELQDLVTDIMRRKLLRRTRKQKSELSLKDLENIEKRASSAFGELGMAWQFSYVIPNHDGEDSENWDAFYYPIVDALKSLQPFVSLYRNEKSIHVETWEKGLLPNASN